MRLFDISLERGVDSVDTLLLIACVMNNTQENNKVRATVKRDFRTKKGVEIKSGEKVELSFTVKASANSARGDIYPFHPSYVRLTTDDGRVILTNDLKGAGLRKPSLKQLEYWTWDSVCESVFGTDVEPDGWSYDGSPSWLLALGMI